MPLTPEEEAELQKRIITSHFSIEENWDFVDWDSLPLREPDILTAEFRYKLHAKSLHRTCYAICGAVFERLDFIAQFDFREAYAEYANDPVGYEEIDFNNWVDDNWEFYLEDSGQTEEEAFEYLFENGFWKPAPSYEFEAPTWSTWEGRPDPLMFDDLFIKGGDLTYPDNLKWDDMLNDLIVTPFNYINIGGWTNQERYEQELADGVGEVDSWGPSGFTEEYFRELWECEEGEKTIFDFPISITSDLHRTRQPLYIIRQAYEVIKACSSLLIGRTGSSDSVFVNESESEPSDAQNFDAPNSLAQAEAFLTPLQTLAEATFSDVSANWPATFAGATPSPSTDAYDLFKGSAPATDRSLAGSAGYGRDDEQWGSLSEHWRSPPFTFPVVYYDDFSRGGNVGVSCSISATVGGFLLDQYTSFMPECPAVSIQSWSDKLSVSSGDTGNIGSFINAGASLFIAPKETVVPTAPTIDTVTTNFPEPNPPVADDSYLKTQEIRSWIGGVDESLDKADYPQYHYRSIDTAVTKTDGFSFS